jgi:hypothetical protein
VQGDRFPTITATIKDRNDANADPQDPDTWPVVDLSTGLSGVRVDYYQGGKVLLDVTENITLDTYTKVNADGDTIATGLVNGDRVRFSTSGTIPTGLAETTLYYVVNSITSSEDVTAANPMNSFQVSTTEGGSAVDITVAGSGQLSVIKQFDASAGSLVGDGSGGQFTFTHPALVFENPGSYEVEYVVVWTTGKETAYYRDTLEIRSK